MMISNMTHKEKNNLLTTLWDDPSVTLQGVKDDTVSSMVRMSFFYLTRLMMMCLSLPLRAWKRSLGRGNK